MCRNVSPGNVYKLKIKLYRCDDSFRVELLCIDKVWDWLRGGGDGGEQGQLSS